jgi:GxxExxY protein
VVLILSKQPWSSSFDNGDVNRQDAADAKLPEPDEDLDTELALRGIPFRRQVAIALEYKGAPIGQARLDVVVAGRLVVELKATEALLPIHRAQRLSYLKATRHSLGLLMNFKVSVLRQGIRRVILTQ